MAGTLARMIEEMAVQAVYLETADVAAGVLADPAVAAGWERPSALAKMTVNGLAGHLARQVLLVPGILASEPGSAPIPLLEHFARSAWVTADIDDESNVRVRETGEAAAAGGPEALRERVEAALCELREVLPAHPTGSPVRLPWASWSLSLPDFLVTRLVELSVHCDDLAVSVDIPTPTLPDRAYEAVLDVLCRLAARRHGPVAVLRALSRAERAPASISAL